MNRVFKTILGVLLSSGAYGEVCFVDRDNVTGDEDGRTWQSAFRSVQAGIDAAAISATADVYGEVWVVEGVYDEARPSDTGAIVLREHVAVYGGFAGTGKTRDERDWTTRITLLDGSRALNGAAARHVVLGANNAILDGFTVKPGRLKVPKAFNEGQSGGGTGMLNDCVSPTLVHCTFIGYASESQPEAPPKDPKIPAILRDGLRPRFMSTVCNRRRSTSLFVECVFVQNEGCALANWQAATSVARNCTFTGNSGGAASNMGLHSTMVLLGCRFVGNRRWSGGGAVVNFNDASMTIIDCCFEENTTEKTGGALFNSLLSTVTVRNCTFWQNMADEGGAAIGASGDGSTEALNCTFVSNQTATGGAVYNESGEMSLLNCILWGNEPTAIQGKPDEIRVASSDIQGGFSGEGNINSDPKFYAPESGDLRLMSGSPCIDAGTAQGAPNADAIGVARPQGAGVDMGAYEFVEGDADKDGFSDAQEGAGDTDGDGVNNANDTDSDGNSIGDTQEGSVDCDKDRIPDYLDTDDDGDGLSDADEISRFRTDPRDTDSDDDGVSDSKELETLHSNPLMADTDADGLCDGAEVDTHGTDPNKADTDGDGLNDGEEVNVLKTNPNRSDTDGDALKDGDEVHTYKTNPLSQDSDGDALADGQEVETFRTDPRMADTDKDGMNDGWEAGNGTDPLTDNASGDADNDGLTDIEEYRLGTNPQERSDPPTDYHVANNGGTGENREGIATPIWPTIARAMASAAQYATAAHPVTIHVREGIYSECAIFAPHVKLVGAGPGKTRITYDESTTVEACLIALDEPGASLRDCTLSIPGRQGMSIVLLRIDDVTADVSNVVLDGNDSPNAVGILVSGRNSSASRIQACVFRRLSVGLQTQNTGVTVGGCIFEAIRGDAVFVQLPDETDMAPTMTPFLGNASQDTTSGGNRFRSVVGHFVLNMTEIEVKAENNDWGVSVEADIAAKMFGPVDYLPLAP